MVSTAGILRYTADGIFSEPERSVILFVIPQVGFVIPQKVKKSNSRHLGLGRVMGVEPIPILGALNLYMARPSNAHCSFTV